MSFSNLFSKLEQATAGLGAIKAPQYKIHLGQDNEVLECPFAVVYVQTSGEEDPPNSGNFWAEWQIEIHWNAPQETDGVDQRQQRDAMVAALFDVFMSDTLRDDLNAVGIADFSAIGVRQRAPSFHIVGDQWVNILSMQILCCPSVVYP